MRISCDEDPKPPEWTRSALFSVAEPAPGQQRLAVCRSIGTPAHALWHSPRCHTVWPRPRECPHLHDPKMRLTKKDVPAVISEDMAWANREPVRAHVRCLIFVHGQLHRLQTLIARALANKRCARIDGEHILLELPAASVVRSPATNSLSGRRLCRCPRIVHLDPRSHLRGPLLEPRRCPTTARVRVLIAIAALQLTGH